MSNGLDPDQARHFVGPDLGPKMLERIFSRLQKFPLVRKELKVHAHLSRVTMGEGRLWEIGRSFG